VELWELKRLKDARGGASRALSTGSV